jgi:hypothetical protein
LDLCLCLRRLTAWLRLDLRLCLRRLTPGGLRLDLRGLRLRSRRTRCGCRLPLSWHLARALRGFLLDASLAAFAFAVPRGIAGTARGRGILLNALCAALRRARFCRRGASRTVSAHTRTR